MDQTHRSRALSGRPRGKNLLRWSVALVFVLAVAIPWVKIIRQPRNDFPLHYGFAERLVAGEYMYKDGSDLPYPPFWGLGHAPFTLMPVEVAQPIAFVIGPVAVAWIALLMGRWIHRQPDSLQCRLSVGWVIVVTILLCMSYVVRDFDECGPNLFLVALTWSAAELWVQRRDSSAGACLGLAIALKCTAAIFLGYFIWKRQWKLAASTLIVTAGLTLSPALMHGWDYYARHMRVWNNHAFASFHSNDPGRGTLGEEPLINKSIRPALARFLYRLPEGHSARLQHLWYLDFLDLSAEMTTRIVRAAIVVLGVISAWMFRRRVVDRRDPRLAWELAAVGILGLIVSPVTWGQHCVAALPAAMLLVHYLSGHEQKPRWIWGVCGIILFFTLVLNRSVLGFEFSRVIDSYRPVTWSLFLLLGCVWWRQERMASESVIVKIASAHRQAA